MFVRQFFQSNICTNTVQYRVQFTVRPAGLIYFNKYVGGICMHLVLTSPGQVGHNSGRGEDSMACPEQQQQQQKHPVHGARPPHHSSYPHPSAQLTSSLHIVIMSLSATSLPASQLSSLSASSYKSLQQIIWPLRY